MGSFVFSFCWQPSVNVFTAPVMIGGIVKWIPQDWWGEGQWEGAPGEKKGEIVIIRLDKRRGGGRWRAAWVL